MVAVPVIYKNAVGWTDNQSFTICPDQEKGVLKLVPLRGV